jgi:membrane protein required for beta-lactamase induction
MRQCETLARHHAIRPQLAGAFHVRRPSLGTILVALIPFCGLCFSVSAWDRVYPMVFGLPFNFFWLLSWIVLTSICIGMMYRLEAARTSRDSARVQRERRPE